MADARVTSCGVSRERIDARVDNACEHAVNVAGVTFAPVTGLSTDTWTAIGTIGTLVGLLVAVIAVLLTIAHRRADKREASTDGVAGGRKPSEGTDRLPELGLEIQWMFLTYTDGSIGDEAIGLTLINRKDYRVQWSTAALELQDGTGRSVALIDTAPPVVRLPRWVEPQTSEMTMVDAAQLRTQGIDLKQPIRGRAILGTGEKVLSRVWTPEAADD